VHESFSGTRLTKLARRRCWAAHRGTAECALTHAHFGLLIGVLVYNVLASNILAFAGLILQMTVVLLWPGVALHVALAVWCLSCLRSNVTARGHSLWRSTFTLRE
jgi:hypothetical protein